MSICRIILLLFVSLARAYHEDLPRTVLVHFHLPKSGGEYVNSVFDSKVDFTYTRITDKNRQNTWQAVKLTSSVALDTGMHFLELHSETWPWVQCNDDFQLIRANLEKQKVGLHIFTTFRNPEHWMISAYNFICLHQNHGGCHPENPEHSVENLMNFFPANAQCSYHIYDTQAHVWFGKSPYISPSSSDCINLYKSLHSQMQYLFTTENLQLLQKKVLDFTGIPRFDISHEAINSAPKSASDITLKMLSWAQRWEMAKLSEADWFLYLTTKRQYNDCFTRSEYVLGPVDNMHLLRPVPEDVHCEAAGREFYGLLPNQNCEIFPAFSHSTVLPVRVLFVGDDLQYLLFRSLLKLLGGPSSPDNTPLTHTVTMCDGQLIASFIRNPYLVDADIVKSANFYDSQPGSSGDAYDNNNIVIDRTIDSFFCGNCAPFWQNITESDIVVLARSDDQDLQDPPLPMNETLFHLALNIRRRKIDQDKIHGTDRPRPIVIWRTNPPVTKEQCIESSLDLTEIIKEKVFNLLRGEWFEDVHGFDAQNKQALQMWDTVVSSHVYTLDAFKLYHKFANRGMADRNSSAAYDYCRFYCAPEKSNEMEPIDDLIRTVFYHLRHHLK